MFNKGSFFKKNLGFAIGLVQIRPSKILGLVKYFRHLLFSGTPPPGQELFVLAPLSTPAAQI